MTYVEAGMKGKTKTAEDRICVASFVAAGKNYSYTCYGFGSFSIYLYKVLNFNLTVYVLLSVSLLVICVCALIASIFIDNKSIYENSISTRNKICVYSSIVLILERENIKRKLQVNHSKTLKLINVLEKELEKCDIENYESEVIKMGNYIRTKGSVSIGPLIQYVNGSVNEKGKMEARAACYI